MEKKLQTYDAYLFFPGACIVKGCYLKHHKFKEKGDLIIKMNSKDEKIRENICKAIFDEFMNVTKVLPQLTKLEPTLVNIIPILSEYYNCNIVVHETRGLDYLVYSQPASQNYRHDWPRIGKSIF